jgi:hypothetical protein|tara:strand:+ start:1549 stop:1746 length:198 start_codon:yes stop_codon:yes gene_type:complete
MAKLSHDNALYYMKRAKVLLDHVEEENGEHDHLLPQGGNKELVEIIKDLLFLIDRTGDFEEYDLG